MLTIFSKRKWHKNIFTITYASEKKDNDKSIHSAMGAEYRRYDYMMPQVGAIIDDKLNLHIYI